VYLIVANFSEQKEHVSVVLPEHVFGFYGMPAFESRKVKDLLTGDEFNVRWQPEEAAELDVNGYNGLILKLI
jgi:hypothetical protein